MDIRREAVCGTLESSDLFIEVKPGEGDIKIRIDSVVKRQFGAAIEASIRSVCAELHVGSANIYVSDRGALDCTIRARAQAALLRAGEGPNQ